MRDAIVKAMKDAMRAKSEVELATLRLMSAAIKEKDLSLRAKTGSEDGVGEDEIIATLATMIKQRNESATTYDKGGRQDLADRERQEIEIIKRFLPKQLDDAEIDAAIDGAITDTGAASIRDMGKVMAALKDNFAGQMDFAAASAQVKKRLAEL